jgi:hypothetical protein
MDAHDFPKAEDLIWRFEPGPFNETERSLPVTMYTPWHWVDGLRGVAEFESDAHSDRRTLPDQSQTDGRSGFAQSRRRVGP